MLYLLNLGSGSADILVIIKTDIASSKDELSLLFEKQ